MTTVLLKTGWGGKLGGKKKKSSHGKWNESGALKVLAATAWPNSSAARGNFLSYSQLVSIQTWVRGSFHSFFPFYGAYVGIIDKKLTRKQAIKKRIWRASHPTFSANHSISKLKRANQHHAFSTMSHTFTLCNFGRGRVGGWGGNAILTSFRDGVACECSSFARSMWHLPPTIASASEKTILILTQNSHFTTSPWCNQPMCTVEAHTHAHTHAHTKPQASGCSAPCVSVSCTETPKNQTEAGLHPPPPPEGDTETGAERA